MKKNVGTADRITRILIAVVICALYYTNVIGGTAAIVLLALAGIFVVTSFISICPIYMALGISTRGKKEQK